MLKNGAVNTEKNERDLAQIELGFPIIDEDLITLSIMSERGNKSRPCTGDASKTLVSRSIVYAC